MLNEPLGCYYDDNNITYNWWVKNPNSSSYVLLPQHTSTIVYTIGSIEGFYYFKVQASNNYGSSNICLLDFYVIDCHPSPSKIVNNDSTSSIIDFSVNLFISPNPNDGYMQVEYKIAENETGVLEIYDILGNELLSYPLFEGQNTFNISASSLNQGFYFYRAIAGNKQIAADKIVVIK